MLLQIDFTCAILRIIKEGLLHFYCERGDLYVDQNPQIAADRGYSICRDILFAGLFQASTATVCRPWLYDYIRVYSSVLDEWEAEAMG